MSYLRTTGVEEKYYADGEDALAMKKSLDGENKLMTVFNQVKNLN